MSRLPAMTITWALAALATGCSSPPAHYYTLSATAAAAPAVSKLSVVVGPISVPATIDRPQIVVSTGTNQVSIDEFNRWASPVEDNLARVVAENLVAILGTPRVMLFPQVLSAEVDYRVQIEVRNFESAPGKYASLDTVWTVRRIKDGKIETGRTSIREPTQDSSFEALAAAHSRGVAKLSQDIADAVRGLEAS